MKMRERFEENMRHVRGTQELEGIYLTDADEELLWQWASGKITEEEYNKKAIEKP